MIDALSNMPSYDFSCGVAQHVECWVMYKSAFSQIGDNLPPLQLLCTVVEPLSCHRWWFVGGRIASQRGDHQAE
ncbi:hypothetical protein PR002_g23403 [Phytophthora rubi]|uniref:Uncharacterized protein n=1 Tax=Phytophthora rubi TaxID=129364 RepID=A0A6A3IIU4_9STRA|nr:hypothetical protein PR002_g23403 [Phytophthora rubi]